MSFFFVVGVHRNKAILIIIVLTNTIATTTATTTATAGTAATPTAAVLILARAGRAQGLGQGNVVQGEPVGLRKNENSVASRYGPHLRGRCRRPKAEPFSEQDF